MPSLLLQSDALLAHARNAGADECELVHVNRHTTTIRITDSSITEAKQVFHNSYGIRLIRGQRIASASVSESANISKMIDDCIVNASNTMLMPREFWQGLAPIADKHDNIDDVNYTVNSDTNKNSLQGIYDKQIAEITSKQAADMALSMLNATIHRKIDSISGALNIVSETFEICNTNQMQAAEQSTYVTGFVNAESNSNTPMSSVSGMGHFSARTLAGVKPEEAGASAQDMCLRSIEPVSVESGKYTIIFEPYSVGELLSFVISPNFDLKQVSEGRSCFSQCTDSKRTVASEIVSIYDDPHAPEAIGSHCIDAEGLATTNRRPLIQDGIFENTYSNLYDYYKATDHIKDEYKPQPSANAARIAMPMGRSSEPIPVSAPHNMSISSNKDDAIVSTSEMISEIKNGLVIGRLWYTYAVNPIRGDFSCTARSGIALVQDGHIVSSAKPVRIMHNLLLLLKDTTYVGDDSKCVIQWASHPSITPSICVENVPVMRI